MKYFELLPIIPHGDFQVRNIFNKYILDEPIEDKFLFTKIMQEQDTLESIAFGEYGDSELYWTLVIINDIRDMIYDLPVPDNVLQTIAKQMTIDQEGFLDLGVYGTNYDALQAENDDKRKIKVLKADFINEFLSDALNNKPE
ncbi:unnamed protein product [marine sediment metagenome]|uniref:Uncharacterized protein n=1 Tax=marine sediment metagenome TaxID=412755 RepID=X1C6N2_9ZZZZ